MQQNVILVIAVIAGLIVGGGGAYAVTSGQISTLSNEKTSLQTQVTTLTSEKSQLQTQLDPLITEMRTMQTRVTSLNAEKTSLQTQVETLTSQKEEIENSYNSFLTTIEAMHSSDWTQTVSYNITAGTVKTQSFALDKYGIVWEAVIDFSGTYVSMGHYYWYKGERFFAGSSGISLTIQNHPEIPYYGPQEYLYGTIKLDISKGTHSSTELWVSCTTLTQFAAISRGASAYFESI